MHIQKGLKKDHVLKKSVLGAHPIIQHFIEKLRIPDVIGTYINFDKRMKIETEQVLCLLIHNFLTSPSPLYEIQDWLNPIDIESVGLNADSNSLIYDERVARGLDDFYESKHKEIFFQLSLRAIKIFELDCSRMHNDTTSITFSGKYSDWNAKEKLAHGHNKDHRPDLKQLVLGLTVTADGAIPLLHDIYDGNQSDDQTHLSAHRRLQKLLSCTDFIYVADSKLATEKNLNKISLWRGKFVSVMPRTWGEDGKFRAAVRHDKVKWTHLLSRPNSRKPGSMVDQYYLAQGQHTTRHGYHLYWIKSTQKAYQDFETRERQVHLALDELKALQPKLNKYNLKTQKQIDAKIKIILKDKRCSKLVCYRIDRHHEYENIYKKTGRPTPSSPTKKTRNTFFSISFYPDKEAIKEDSKTDGVFPLITNLEGDQYNAKEVLQIYKFQPFLEKRYSQLKTYQEVSPVYLKNGNRSVAILHIQVMALMVAALIERQLKLAMHKEGIKALPIYPEERACKTPTMFDLVRLFRDVERYEVVQSGVVSIYPATLNKSQKEVLRLLQIPQSSYQ
jgi:transposase